MVMRSTSQLSTTKMMNCWVLVVVVMMSKNDGVDRASLKIMAPKRPYLIATAHVPQAKCYSPMTDTPAAHIYDTQFMTQ